MANDATATPNPQLGEIEILSGPAEQLSPLESQIGDGLSEIGNTPPEPLIQVAEPEKREPPGPSVPFAPEVAAAYAAVSGTPIKVGFPILRIDRYAGADKTFQRLIAWEIPAGYVGDLHEMSVLSNNDAKTIYRVTIAGTDMQVPLDRPTTTPQTWLWRDVSIPGPTECLIEVASTDGTNITVDGQITGTFRLP